MKVGLFVELFSMIVMVKLVLGLEYVVVVYLGVYLC